MSRVETGAPAETTQRLIAARHRFAESVARFRTARTDAWTVWATAQVERIVVEQFETTSELSDEELASLKRLAGMSIVGHSARMPAEHHDVLEPAHWEGTTAFDARSARIEIDTVWQDLPATLVDAMRSLGYDVPLDGATAGRSAAHRVAEQAEKELLAACAELVSAAGRERAATGERLREAARGRWSTA